MICDLLPMDHERGGIIISFNCYICSNIISLESEKAHIYAINPEELTVEGMIKCSSCGVIHNITYYMNDTTPWEL